MLRYEHEEDRQTTFVYRLIVLSRNLTFDRSWDVAACLEGKPEAEPLAWNKPLVDFHAWLNEADGRFGERHRRSSTNCARVNFEVPESFDDYSFHPIGIPGYKSNPTATRQAQRLLCLSPFLHPQALDTLWQQCRRDSADP